ASGEGSGTPRCRRTSRSSRVRLRVPDVRQTAVDLTLEEIVRSPLLAVAGVHRRLAPPDVRAVSESPQFAGRIVGRSVELDCEAASATYTEPLELPFHARG